jgi:hypothetical protein
MRFIFLFLRFSDKVPLTPPFVKPEDLILRQLTTILAVSLLFAAAACGGSDDSSGSSATSNGAPAASGDSDTQGNAADANNSTDSKDQQSQAPAASDGGGFIELNGERHDVEQVRRCIPFEAKEDDLDLAAIAQGGALQLLITTTHTEVQTGPQPMVLESQDVDLQGPAAGGLWSGSAGQSPSNGDWLDSNGNPLDGPAFTVDGDRLTGSTTLPDFNGGPDTVDMSFEFSIPAEAIDCSLR